MMPQSAALNWQARQNKPGSLEPPGAGRLGMRMRRNVELGDFFAGGVKGLAAWGGSGAETARPRRVKRNKAEGRPKAT